MTRSSSLVSSERALGPGRPRHIGGTAPWSTCARSSAGSRFRRWLPDLLRVAADGYAEASLLVGVAWTLEYVALAEIGAGDPRATATVTRLAELSLELDSPLMSGLASLFEGVVALRAGDPERGADAARTALQQWRGQPYEIHVLQALDVVAWASAAGGDSTTAGRLLAITNRTRAERGWAVSAAESSWHDPLRARGARLRPATGWPSLTPTEREVVALVAEGLTNPDAAERLFMSRSTVKTHLNHVFAKLGISTRAELAAAYVRDHQERGPRGRRTLTMKRTGRGCPHPVRFRGRGHRRPAPRIAG